MEGRTDFRMVDRCTELGSAWMGRAAAPTWHKLLHPHLGGARRRLALRKHHAQRLAQGQLDGLGARRPAGTAGTWGTQR